MARWWQAGLAVLGMVGMLHCSSSSGGGSSYGRDRSSNTSSPVGGPCASDEACGEGGFCDLGQPNGFCSKPCLGLGDCPSGSECVSGPAGGLMCRSTCTSDAQCRAAEGYQCATGSQPSVCVGACGVGGCTPGGTSSSSGTPPTPSSSSGGTTPVCKNGGESCTRFDECCSGTCAGNQCTECSGGCQSCKVHEASCTTSAECCSNVCRQGLCAACVGHRGACTFDGECCGGTTCQGGRCCTPDAADRDCSAPVGSSCGSDLDCAVGLRCEGNTCCDVPGTEYGYYSSEVFSDCSLCCGGLSCELWWESLNLPYVKCCVGLHGACTGTGSCCDGTCTNGFCCMAEGERCSGASDCCNNLRCVNSTCTP